MAKAVAVVRWLKWVANDDEREQQASTGDEDQMSWRDAVSRVEEGLQTAVQARGLGQLDI